MNTALIDGTDIDDAEMWTILLASPECTDEERSGFETWLAISAENPARYSRAQRIHTLTRELAGDDLLKAELYRARRATSTRSLPVIRWASMGLAAILAIAVAVPVWMTATDDGDIASQRYTAAIGEQRKIRLSDGTQVVLDTGSEITTRFDDRERRIDLVQGQVEFVVAQNRDRPLVVYAAQAQIKDIGTTFQVRNIDQKLSVTLISGLLSVRNEKRGPAAVAITIKPGQKLTFGSNGAPIVSAVDIDQVSAWTQGDLYVQEQRLDHLLLEMNRYSQRKIRLADPADGAILISGKYKATDQSALLKSLDTGWSLRADNATPNEVVLKHR